MPQRLLKCWQTMFPRAVHLRSWRRCCSYRCRAGCASSPTTMSVNRLRARPLWLSKRRASAHWPVTADGRFCSSKGRARRNPAARRALTARLRLLIGKAGQLSSGALRFRAIGSNTVLPTVSCSPAYLPGEQVAPRASPLRDWVDTAILPGEPPTQETQLTLKARHDNTVGTGHEHHVFDTAGGGGTDRHALTGMTTLDWSEISTGPTRVSVVDKAAVFRRCCRVRRLAALWLPLAGLIVLAVLAGRYGLRQGAAIRFDARRHGHRTGVWPDQRPVHSSH